MGVVTATHLLTAADSTNATSYVTASVNLSANKLVLLAVISAEASGPLAPTVTGASRTWTQVNSKLDGSGLRRITVFRSLAASANSGALTISFGAVAQLRCGWSISEFGEVDTTGTNGANAVVQSAVNTAIATSLTVTLAAFGSTDNATYGAIVHVEVVAGDTITPGTGFTELGEAYTPSEGGVIQTQWKTANDTSVDWTSTNSIEKAGIAIEIKYTATPVSGGQQVITII